MKPLKMLRNLFLGALTIAVCLNASALDLSTKKVNGRVFYVYKVKKNETIYGVSKTLGLTRDEIVRHNPTAADGLKKGMTLYFPYEEYSEPEVVEVIEPVEEVDSVIVSEQTPSVAVILPFGLNSTEQSRQNKLALDFYRGFLIAADSLSNRPGELEINVYDCGNNVNELRSLLGNTPQIANSSVIIGPEDEEMLEVLEQNVAGTDSYVLNIFNVRDSAYLSNANVLQANIPQKDMYALAIKAFLDYYEGYTPVILRNEKGRNEKESFVDALVEELTSHQVEPIWVKYNGTLLVADLDVMEKSEARKYVVVPSSGALTEFNKFALVVKALRDRAAEQMSASGDEDEVTEIALFGYPDWTAFRGDALELLQKLNARVYSRFYDNFLSFDSRIINDDFRFWYGVDMIESIPSQGLLGYDTGSYIIRNMRANDGRFNPQWQVQYQGIQSVFRFSKTTDGGYYNKALYIVDFLPEGRMTQRIVY